MISDRINEPGSQISIWMTDTSVSECYEAGQFLASMTRGREGLPLVDENRALYWRNQIVGALFELSNGLVLDTRTDGGGGPGGIDGVLIAKVDTANPGAVILIACEGSEYTKPKLLARARQWAASRGRKLGHWEVQKPKFVEA
jgi:hypothetical protein